MNDLPQPHLDASKILRRLSRRKGKKRGAFLTKTIFQFISEITEYRINKTLDPKLYNPDEEWGGIDNYFSKDRRVRKAVVLMAMATAVKTLPEGTDFEIRHSVPSDFGRKKGVAWYRHPEYITIENAIDLPVEMNPEYDVAGGYSKGGWYKT